MSGLSPSKRKLLLTCLGMLSACMLRRKKNATDLSPEIASSDLPPENDVSSSTPQSEDPISVSGAPIQNQIGDPNLIFGQKTGLCFVSTNTVDMQAFEDVQEIFQAKMKLYGTKRSALIAIGFPKYQHRTLDEVYLCTAKGQILARTRITKNSDELEDETLKPIYFDHIYIGSKQNFALLIKESGEKIKKYLFFFSIKFEHQINGKRVYGLSPLSIPTSEYRSFYVDSTFTPQVEQFEYKKDLNEKIDASKDTLYEAGSLPGKSIVTNLMGDVITNTPDLYENFARYSAFIVYRPSEEGFYYRSIVKII